MQHFDGARLSPNSVRNAVWHALNEPVCQYLRARNPRCSNIYIENNLGGLANNPILDTSSVKSTQIHGERKKYLATSLFQNIVLWLNTCEYIVAKRS